MEPAGYVFSCISWRVSWTEAKHTGNWVYKVVFHWGGPPRRGFEPSQLGVKKAAAKRGWVVPFRPIPFKDWIQGCYHIKAPEVSMVRLDCWYWLIIDLFTLRNSQLISRKNVTLLRFRQVSRNCDRGWDNRVLFWIRILDYYWTYDEPDEPCLTESHSHWDLIIIHRWDYHGWIVC